MPIWWKTMNDSSRHASLARGDRWGTVVFWPKKLPLVCKVMANHCIGSLQCAHIVLFLCGCCMAQRCRCPGGRPSVSCREMKKTPSIGCSIPIKPTTSKAKKHHQPQSSLPESAGEGEGGLFLGQLDQRLIGNAESTHVDRPKGKAQFVPKNKRCCSSNNRQWAYDEGHLIKPVVDRDVCETVVECCNLR